MKKETDKETKKTRKKETNKEFAHQKMNCLFSGYPFLFESVGVTCAYSVMPVQSGFCSFYNVERVRERESQQTYISRRIQ